MHKLHPNTIINIHDILIQYYGGEYGIRDIGLLYSSSESPYQTFDNNELFPSIYEKAARYLTGFSGYQIFIDGNKRTGIAVALFYLYINGYTSTFSEDRLQDLVMLVANNPSTSVSDIADYFRLYTSPTKQQTVDILQHITQKYDNMFYYLADGEPNGDKL